MNAPRVGVVGGAGRIGTALLKALSEDWGFPAFGICRNNMSAARLACQGLQVRVARTEDGAQLTEATRDLDILINCAIALYGPSKTSAANQRLAESLAVASAGKHVIHLSSVGVYGDFILNRSDLFDNPKPDTVYGGQKVQMESLLRTQAKNHSAKCTILRVGHVYGVELPWSQNIFELIKKDGFRLPFDGQLPSNAVCLTNLIAGIRQVMFNEPAHPTLNVTDVPQTTWREIFDLHSQALGSPTVLPFLPSESDRCFRECKKWAETGMAARVAIETLRWVKHLPASYIASVPTFKAMSQRASAIIGSENLDARLRATNCKRSARSLRADAAPEIIPALLSEPVPGPCLSYKGTSPAEGLAGLRAWHDTISAPPLSFPLSDLFSETSRG
jgi:nucleoside-diphosphate-sugar epimerase